MDVSDKLILWYLEEKRDLPWRKTKDPYKIWLSEIILQQTRVEQGLDYYHKFVNAYPTVGLLAEADEEETLAAEFFALAPVFIVVWMALNAGRLLRLQPEAEMPDVEPSIPVTEAFWQRVPVSIGRDLIALSAELHYLRVRTAQGDALVLYAFGTAVSELSASAAPGQQTHRSHWVMQHHIQKIERVGQRAICHMTDGTQIPVSRAYRAAIEAAVPGDQSTGA